MENAPKNTSRESCNCIMRFLIIASLLIFSIRTCTLEVLRRDAEPFDMVYELPIKKSQSLLREQDKLKELPLEYQIKLQQISASNKTREVILYCANIAGKEFSKHTLGATEDAIHETELAFIDILYESALGMPIKFYYIALDQNEPQNSDGGYLPTPFFHVIVFTNSEIAQDDLGEYNLTLSEAAHAFQNTSNPPFSLIKQIRGKAGRDYLKFGSMEYEAHSLIEEFMIAYLKNPENRKYNFRKSLKKYLRIIYKFTPRSMYGKNIYPIGFTEHIFGYENYSPGKEIMTLLHKDPEKFGIILQTSALLHDFTEFTTDKEDLFIALCNLNFTTENIYQISKLLRYNKFAEAIKFAKSQATLTGDEDNVELDVLLGVLYGAQEKKFQYQQQAFLNAKQFLPSSYACEDTEQPSYPIYFDPALIFLGQGE